jgi:hypothetical protein
MSGKCGRSSVQTGWACSSPEASRHTVCRRRKEARLEVANARSAASISRPDGGGDRRRASVPTSRRPAQRCFDQREQPRRLGRQPQRGQERLRRDLRHQTREAAPHLVQVLARRRREHGEVAARQFVEPCPCRAQDRRQRLAHHAQVARLAQPGGQQREPQIQRPPLHARGHAFPRQPSRAPWRPASARCRPRPRSAVARFMARLPHAGCPARGTSAARPGRAR